MDYPLNMTKASEGGYAVARSEEEHKTLSDLGYEPKFVAIADADPNESDGDGHTVQSLRAQLDAAGIAYDKRFGVAKLLALLPQ